MENFQMAKFVIDDIEDVPRHEESSRIWQNAQQRRRSFRYYETQDGHSSGTISRFIAGVARVHV